MARPLRIEYEGAFYHITARGNEQKRICFNKTDYEKFLKNRGQTLNGDKIVLIQGLTPPLHSKKSIIPYLKLYQKNEESQQHNNVNQVESIIITEFHGK